MKQDRRSFLKGPGAALVLLGTGVLGGCGFQPVYGDLTRSGADVTQDLHAVWIAEGGNREGQILHNFLLDRFNPKGRPRNPTATLSTKLNVSAASLGTQIDESTVRARLTVSAESVLIERDSGTSWEFESEAVVGYSTTTDVYAAQVAENSALEQALRAVADDLRIQIATFYEKRRLLAG